MIVGIENLEYKYPPWGIAFTVKMDMVPDANQAIVQLWNLSRHTIRQLKRGQVVKLWAGYEEDEVGLCFAGVIDKISVKYQDVDKILTLTVLDQKDSVLARRPNKSWPPGTPYGVVVEDLFNMAGLKVGAIEVQGTYDKGIVFDPKHSIKKALDEVAKSAEYKAGKPYQWWVDQGYGYFVPRDWKGMGKAVVLTPETGLIEQPEPLTEIPEEIAGEDVAPRQWRVRSVFNFRVAPGWVVEVDCKRFKGRLKVVSLQHICTPKEKFETDMVCDELEVSLIDYDYMAGDERMKPPLPGLEEEEGGESE